MFATKTAKFLLLYTLYFVIAVTVYVFFYLHIDGQEVKATEAFVKIEQLKQQNNQNQDLVAMVRDTEVGRERISNFFVDSDRIIEFLETIEALAETSNVEVDVRSINEGTSESEAVKSLELNIDFEGGWSEVHHFLVLLESIPIKMTVERLSFNEFRKDELLLWKGSVYFTTLQLKQ